MTQRNTFVRGVRNAGSSEQLRSPRRTAPRLTPLRGIAVGGRPYVGVIRLSVIAAGIVSPLTGLLTRPLARWVVLYGERAQAKDMSEWWLPPVRAYQLLFRCSSAAELRNQREIQRGSWRS